MPLMGFEPWTFRLLNTNSKGGEKFVSTGLCTWDLQVTKFKIIKYPKVTKNVFLIGFEPQTIEITTSLLFDLQQLYKTFTRNIEIRKLVCNFLKLYHFLKDYLMALQFSLFVVQVISYFDFVSWSTIFFRFNPTLAITRILNSCHILTTFVVFAPCFIACLIRRHVNCHVIFTRLSF